MERGDRALSVESREHWALRAWKTASDARLIYVYLAFVLIVGAGLRVFGLNWDQGQHLHPDERFLTMVETALRWPANLAEYFDTARNPLSPYNNGYSFFVYGTLPLYVVKWLGTVLSRGGYEEIHLVGRLASGAFDLGSVFVLFLLGRRLYGEWVALLGATLLSLSVLNIQQSHFFVVDTFANFFVVLTVYLSVRASASGRWWEFALAGIALGMGVASKISVYTLGLVVTLAAILYVYDAYRRRQPGMDVVVERAVVRLVLAAMLSVLVFRVLQPITFQGPTILNFSINERWLANMQEVRELMDGTRDTPPGIQWTNRPAILFPLQNIVWGMGFPLAVVGWIGWALALYELTRHRKLAHLLPVVFTAVAFLTQGTQFVKSMRYMLPVYPFLALFAGYFVLSAWRWASIGAQSAGARILTSRNKRILAVGLAATVVGGTALWALAFSTIYTRPHSRVEASRWMLENLPKGSKIAWEHWDDPLPLRIDGADPYGFKWYEGVELPLYHDDNPEKLDLIVQQLTKADYLLLSSNRLYDSIPRLPMRYPMTTRYYELLFAGKLGFELEREFTSYPGLFGLTIPDQSAEEAFSVYDHPKVTIFRKAGDFDPARLRADLSAGIDWNSIVRLRPDQASRVPSALMLSSDERPVYELGGTWSQLYDRDGPANRYPVAVWVAVLVVLGAVAAPLTMTVLSRLSDRGYLFARPLGLLVVGWTTWVLASLRIVVFDLLAVLIAVALVATASLFVLAATRTELVKFVRTRWKLLLAEEAVFWLLFGGFVLIRFGNPDLWHPYMGGEKPMDFAYLNAVLKSAYFPPYDPWFAGGYINYYYFGFVLVAVLVKLSGIVPQVAYNLAIPTLFAFTGAGAFAVAYCLADGWRERRRGVASSSGNGGGMAWLAGLCGTLFVAVFGNLHELRMINDGLREFSKIGFPSYIPGLVGLVQAADGFRQSLLEGRALPFRTEWWYWNATRVIEHPSSEAGPINEFPFFTFLYGDLHAHMMALPFTLLALALAVNFVRDEGRAIPLAVAPAGRASAGIAGLFERFRLGGAGELILPGLVVGALWPINTWDFPTYLVIVGAALACREYWRRGRVDGSLLWNVGWRWASIFAIGYLAFVPFHRHYANAYGSVELWRGSRTLLDAYLDMHGQFLFFIVTFLVISLWFGRGQSGTVRLIRFALGAWRRPRRATRLYQTAVRSSFWHRLSIDAAFVALLLVLGFMILRLYVFALVIALGTVAAFLLFGGRASPRRQFVLCLIGLGLALTLVVEIVVLKGDIARMNTVFKFYFQVWTLWAVACAALVPRLITDLGLAVRTVADRAAAVGRPPTWAKVAWFTALALILLAASLYPYYATRARVSDRFAGSAERTLDGSAYMATSVYEDEGYRMPLADDLKAIEWLQDNVTGSPAILEGVAPPYRWGGRVSIYTGLPTVLGWDWHQRQQRAALMVDVVERRAADVRAIYADTDTQAVVGLLRRYDVRYVYLGPVERKYYAGPGLEKFARDNGAHWQLVYSDGTVQIYRVL